MAKIQVELELDIDKFIQALDKGPDDRWFFNLAKDHEWQRFMNTDDKRVGIQFIKRQVAKRLMDMAKAINKNFDVYHLDLSQVKKWSLLASSDVSRKQAYACILKELEEKGR